MFSPSVLKTSVSSFNTEYVLTSLHWFPFRSLTVVPLMLHLYAPLAADISSLERYQFRDEIIAATLLTIQL